MSRYAILSDVHGRIDRLRTVLADARQRRATAFVDLGDVVYDACYDLLRQVDAQAVFGNYEVTRWGDLSAENQRWVRALPPLLAGDTFLAAHAVPYFPNGIQSVDQVIDYMLLHNIRWNALFPRIDQDESARWLTCAELQVREKRIFFHGHTHVQEVWRVDADGLMIPLHECVIQINADGCYIVGVGSVGQPQEGCEPRYAIYDQALATVELCKVGAGFAP